MSERTFVVADSVTRDTPYFHGARGKGITVFAFDEGTVSAYRLDPGSGRLSYINKQPSLGSILAHNSLDRTGRFLFAANYSVYAEPDDSLPDQSVVVMPIRADGGLGPAVCSRAHSGRGHNGARQERSHAHCVLASFDNAYVLVADLGIDQLVADCAFAASDCRRGP